MKNRKETTAADFAKEVIAKNGLEGSEVTELNEIISFTKRPNETSPTLISAVSAWMCGKSVEQVKQYFVNEP